MNSRRDAETGNICSTLTGLHACGEKVQQTQMGGVHG